MAIQFYWMDQIFVVLHSYYLGFAIFCFWGLLEVVLCNRASREIQFFTWEICYWPLLSVSDPLGHGSIIHVDC